MPYVGGKQTMADRIVALMAPHDHYIEPFFGGVDGIIGRDPWVLVCRDCGETVSGTWLLGLVSCQGFRFHRIAWPDGANPRLCPACRLARGCDCYGCEAERQGTEYPTRRKVE